MGLSYPVPCLRCAPPVLGRRNYTGGCARLRESEQRIFSQLYRTLAAPKSAFHTGPFFFRLPGRRSDYINLKWWESNPRSFSHADIRLNYQIRPVVLRSFWSMSEPVASDQFAYTSCWLVRVTGLEPALLSEIVPKTIVAANYTIPAKFWGGTSPREIKKEIIE